MKTNSYCVGGRHQPATTKICGDITSKGSKVLIGYCSICNRKTSMTVSDNTIKAEGLGDFFKSLGKKGLNVSKKVAKNVISNPGRALDLTAKVATAAVSKFRTGSINITRIDNILQYRKRSLLG